MTGQIQHLAAQSRIDDLLRRAEASRKSAQREDRRELRETRVPRIRIGALRRVFRTAAAGSR